MNYYHFQNVETMNMSPKVVLIREEQLDCYEAQVICAPQGVYESCSDEPQLERRHFKVVQGWILVLLDVGKPDGIRVSARGEGVSEYPRTRHQGLAPPT